MHSNMEEKTPNPEKRSPHLRFFHAMVKAIAQILKAKWLEELSASDQETLETLRLLKTITEESKFSAPERVDQSVQAPSNFRQAWASAQNADPLCDRMIRHAHKAEAGQLIGKSTLHAAQKRSWERKKDSPQKKAVKIQDLIRHALIMCRA